MLELLLLNLSCAPLVDTPPRPPVTSMPVEACTVATDTADDPDSVDCFPLSAVAIFVPPTVNDPVIDAAPATLRVLFNTAAPSACSSRVDMRSRHWMSAVQVRAAIDSCEVELIEAPAFAAIVAVMSVPFR